MVQSCGSLAPMVQLENMADDPNSEPTKHLPHGLPHTLELSGGILILARVKPSEEEDFAQILLPVALSYETFLCKLCVALGVEKEDVKKILKLPDILIRTTEDVVRLENWDKLEVRLKRKSPLRTAIQKMSDTGRSLSPGLGLCGLVLYMGVILAGQVQLRSDLGALAANLSATRDVLASLGLANLSHLTTLSAFPTSSSSYAIGRTSGPWPPTSPPPATSSPLSASPTSPTSPPSPPSPHPPPRELREVGLEALAASIREPIGDKLDYLERGIISLAQRVKETKSLLLELRSCSTPLPNTRN